MQPEKAAVVEVNTREEDRLRRWKPVRGNHLENDDQLPESKQRNGYDGTERDTRAEG